MPQLIKTPQLFSTVDNETDFHLPVKSLIEMTKWAVSQKTYLWTCLKQRFRSAWVFAVWSESSLRIAKEARILITKTHLYNFDPLKPHFYIVKLGFTGVYIIFLISAQNIDCGYSLEPPRWGGSNEYPQSMFWAEIWKISEFFIW